MYLLIFFFIHPSVYICQNIKIIKFYQSFIFFLFALFVCFYLSATFYFDIIWNNFKLITAKLAQNPYYTIEQS